MNILLVSWFLAVVSLVFLCSYLRQLFRTLSRVKTYFDEKIDFSPAEIDFLHDKMVFTPDGIKFKKDR